MEGTQASRTLQLGLAAALALAAETSGAQALHGCGPGQAIQSSDASGRNLTCVRVGEAETSVVGRYSFTGTQSCVASSLNFNADFTPAAPPPAPGVPGPVTSNVVSSGSTSSWGTRTFNEDGSGTVEIFGMVVNSPGAFYNAFASGLTTTVLRGPTGGLSTFHLNGEFRWRIEGDKLIVDDGIVRGTVTTPGPRFGWITYARGVPPLVATLGKDLKVISLVQQTPAVEVVVSQNPDNLAQIFETPRVCTRERLLIKQ